MMFGLKQINNNEKAETLPVLLTPLSKTIRLDDGSIAAGVDVRTHSIITGFVAQELCKRLPDFLADKLLKLNAPFFAACHDIGKISPDFQRMIYENIEKEGLVEKYPELKSADVERCRRSGKSFHAVVSKSLFNGERQKYGREIAKAIGWHHGSITNDAEGEDSDIYGGQKWNNARHRLYEELIAGFLKNEPEKIKKWDDITLIGGFITVCDWIASGTVYNDLPLEHGKSDDELRKMAIEAVDFAGFKRLEIVKQLSFSTIFGFEPRKIQQDLYEEITGPGVYILEAPMGLGKTEAALYAAYKMLETGKANGIYFGLPTQLTSNKIYERVAQFLKKIVPVDQHPFFKLLHGAAWLEDLAALGGDIEFGGDGDVGGSWFDNRKRGILAPFAVGTVDQALMAVINVKHAFVRDFGLAGKVVILDEIHSYDAYTSTILAELVKRLRELDCTVIILSATLTAAQKQKLLQGEVQEFAEEYPLITSEIKKVVKQKSSESSTGRDVNIDISSDENAVIEEALAKADNGEQVLWIENSVAEAQEKFKILAARGVQLGIECGLIHSRYTHIARQNNESKWVGIYGKNGQNERPKCGRILVGTQVLEQSIDIDADLLVSRICPMDMLLQRVGRLWRHIANDRLRPVGSCCKTIVLVPSQDKLTTDKEPFGTTGIVYSPYILFRTLENIKNIDKISLPTDIRGLLEKTYSERKETGLLATLKEQLFSKKSEMEHEAYFAQATNNSTKSDDMAATRYSEDETVNLVLLDYFEASNDHCIFQLHGSDKRIMLPKVLKDKRKKREIAKELQLCSVIVPVKNAPVFDDCLKDYFAGCLYLGDMDDEQPWRAVIVKNGQFFNLHNVEITGNYDDRIGYTKGDKRG